MFRKGGGHAGGSGQLIAGHGGCQGVKRVSRLFLDAPRVAKGVSGPPCISYLDTVS